MFLGNYAQNTYSLKIFFMDGSLRAQLGHAGGFTMQIRTCSVGGAVIGFHEM